MKLLYSLLRIIRTALITILSCLLLFVIVIIGVVFFLGNSDTGIKTDARYKIIWLDKLPGISPSVLADQGKTYKVFEPLWYDGLTGETWFFAKILSTNNFSKLSYSFKGNAENLESFHNEIVYVNNGENGLEMGFAGVKDGFVGFKDGLKCLVFHPVKSAKDIGGLILNGSKYIYKNVQTPDKIKSDAIQFGNDIFRKTYVEICNDNKIDSNYLITEEAKQQAANQAKAKLLSRSGFELSALVIPTDAALTAIKGTKVAGEITALAAITADSTRVEKSLNNTAEIARNANNASLLERLTYTKSYGELAKELAGKNLQANHLNQDAAFGSIIPKEEGVAVGMRGNAFKDVGSPHFEFHKSLETFWDVFRPGGSKAGSVPTCSEYNAALRSSLRDAGYSSEEAENLVKAAADQQREYGLYEQALIPRVPGRINQIQ